MVQMRYDGVKKLDMGDDDDDLMRFIEKEDSNSSVTTDSDESKRYSNNIRRSCAHLLTCNNFQLTTMAFVFIDCVLVIAVVMVDLGVFQSHVHSFVPQILRFISIGIVGLFLSEVFLKSLILGKAYFTRIEELFDIAVIIITLSLQIAFIKDEGLRCGIGLLIFLRLWRITKIINNIIESVKRRSERRLVREQRVREALERELLKYREYCSTQEFEIQFLRGLLRQHHIDYQHQAKPRAGQTIDVVAEVNAFNPSGGTNTPELRRVASLEVLSIPDN